MRFPRGVTGLLRSVLKWSARVLLVLALCLFVVVALLFVPQTRVLLVERVVSALEGDVQITMSGLQSPAFGRWSIESFEVQWRNEPWLAGRKLYLEFEPGALLDKQINVVALSADYFSWTQPASGFAGQEKKDENEAGKLPEWSARLDMLAINKLELNLAALNFPATAQQAAFSLNASAQLLQPNLPFALNLDLRGLDNSLLAKVDSDVDNDRVLGLRAEISENKGGIIASLIRFPVDQDLKLDLAAKIKNHDSGFDFHIEQAHTVIYNIALGLQAQVQTPGDFSQLTINEANISTGEHQHQLSGMLDFVEKQLAIELNLQHFPLKIISPWVNGLEDGYLNAEARAEGPWARPAMQGKLQGEIAGTHRNWSPRLQFSSQLAFDWQLLDVQDLQIRDLQGSVQSAQASGKWQIQEGDLQVALQTGEIQQSFLEYLRSYFSQIPKDLHIANIGYLKGKLQGNVKNQLRNASFDLQTHVTGSYREEALVVEAAATGKGPVFDIQKLVASSGAANLEASGRVDIAGTKNNLQVSARNVPLELLEKQGVPLPENLTGNVDANAHLQNSLKNMQVDFDVNSALSYVLHTPENDTVLEKMRFTANGSWQKKVLQLQELKLQLLRKEAEPVSLLVAKADVAIAEKRLAISARTQDFPTALITPYGWTDSKGLINFDLQVNSALTDIVSEQGLEQLTAEGHLRYQTEQIDRKTGNPISLAIEMDLSNEQDKEDKQSWWLAELSMSHGEQNSRNLRLRTQSASIVKFLEDRSQLPMTEIVGELDFSFFNFLLPKSQHLAGVLKSDLWVEGAMQRPTIQGDVILEGGTVVNERYGIRLQNISANARFIGQRMELTSLTANDVGKGKMQGKGHVDWQADKELGELDFDITAKNFEMIRHRQIEGKIDAALELEGNFQSLLLKGDIELTPFAVSIAQSPVAGVPKLNYEFREEDGTEEEVSQRLMPQLFLDLKINVDKQAYVRGRGLEAELAGAVVLQGPVNDLEYKGEFKTVRGQFNVMGKRFVLDKGDVRFSNNALAIYVRGLYEERDFKATAELRGTNDKFEVKLSSEPTMPEDELLARLIFGRSVEEMTPLQAIQLAQAVQTLRGGGGFDPVEKARDVLNVDTIKVDTDETEEGQTLSFGAGKYITDKIYLELERSSDPVYPWQGNIMIELTPYISLESSTGGSTGGFAEILWKYDY